MTNTFYYSVVKVVPHPIREETFNIGVVLVSRSGVYSNFRFTTAVKSKLRVFGPDVHSATIRRFIEDFQSRFPKVGTMEPLSAPDRIAASVEALEEFAGYYSTQIKFTPPRPVMAENPDTTLERLFEEFVAPIRLSRERLIDRVTIKRWVVQTLHELQVPKTAIVDRPMIAVRHGHNTLDIGIRPILTKNGTVAVGLEPISFVLPSTDEVVRQRDHVAWVAHDIIPFDNITPMIGAVVTQPTNANRRLFEESCSIFRDVGVSVIPFEEEPLLREILVRAHVG